MRLDSAGNLGLGVTPSAWISSWKAIEQSGVSLASSSTIGIVGQNWWINSSGSDRYLTTAAASIYKQTAGAHSWHNAPSGTAGNAISFTQAMTLDASGNLLVGTTSNGNSAKFLVVGGSSVGDLQSGFGGTNGTSARIYHADAGGSNAANTVLKIEKVSATGRSINAAGTVNAAGLDYAEYMTKAGDFTVAKGAVVGIDTNGKLTNVFADAISFCVKSTAPSYVGGDTWGAELEGAELEAARQTVDRIAFAGQVPVNVIGATAGQYVIPINDSGAIKGQAVTNLTFEQYQQAVGKVIAVEADGRARIIVKAA